MTATTVFRFLFGQRDAIEQIAASPKAVWLGLLFVLSAGLAREYDGEYLVAEPWHLLIPLAASLATSFILFCAVSAVWFQLSEAKGTWSRYPRFLALYWMTAPLAWLYAIPVERFLSAADATRVNLLLLLIVSVWRVLLMIQVVAVRWNAPHFWSAVVVLTFADVVAILVAFTAPVPILAVMGGVRLTESEQIISNATGAVISLGFLALPVLGLLFIINPFFNLSRRPRPQWTPPRVYDDANSAKVASSAWMLGGGLLALGIALLPAAQAEQQRRHAVARMFEEGEVAKAVAFMSQRDQDDFPPHWDPPPSRHYRRDKPSLIDVFEALLAADAPPWVWTTYQEKLSAEFDSVLTRVTYQIATEQSSFDRWLLVWSKMPNQSAFAQTHVEFFAELLEAVKPSERAQRLETWLGQNGVTLPPPAAREDATQSNWE